MKKKLALALAASFALTTGSAFAAEIPNPLDIKFDGSVTMQYRDDDFKNLEKPSANGLKTTFVLNAEKNLTKNLDLYARFAYQDAKISSDVVGNNGSIDAFGLKYSNAGVNYVVGSQALTLGATGIGYDNGYLGSNALPYAVTASGKVGSTDVRAFYAQTNYQAGISNDKFYGVEASYPVSEKTTIGAVIGTEKINSIAAGSYNFYTVNATTKLSDTVNFTAEYLKSSASTDNKGYVGSVSYKPNSTDKFGVSYWKVEDQASMYDYNAGAMTGYWSNAKGYSLSWAHKLGTDVTLNVADHIFTKINAGSNTYGADNDRNTFRAGVTVNF